MKKVLFCLIFLSFLMIFTSCETIGKVSDSQLRSDIELLDEFQDGYYCRYVNETPFKIKKLEIERHQTTPEDRKDYILCNVQATNKHFEAEFVISMYYDHYDTGGWILSSGYAEIQNIFPIASVDTSELSSIYVKPYEDAYLSAKLDNTHVSDVTFNDNKCIINYHYIDNILDLKGYSTIFFKDGEWSSIDGENFKVTELKVNWSNVSYRTNSNQDHYYEFNTEREYMVDNINHGIVRPEGVDGFDINITSCDAETGKISGVLTIDAGGYYVGWWNDLTHEDIILTIPFDTSFDVKTGRFVVHYHDELKTNKGNTWFDSDDYFTTANCHAEITYNFGKNCWNATFFVDSLYNNPIVVKKYITGGFGFTRTELPNIEKNNDDYSVNESIDSSLGSIDENSLSTIQANVSNLGVACKARDKVFYSDVCTGIYT